MLWPALTAGRLGEARLAEWLAHVDQFSGQGLLREVAICAQPVLTSSGRRELVTVFPRRLKVSHQQGPRSLSLGERRWQRVSPQGREERVLGRIFPKLARQWRMRQLLSSSAAMVRLRTGSSCIRCWWIAGVNPNTKYETPAQDGARSRLGRAR